MDISCDVKNRINSFKTNKKSARYNSNRNIFRKMIASIVSGIVIAGGADLCYDKFTRTSGVDRKNNIVVEYENTSNLVRDSLMKPVYDLKKILHTDNDFLKNIKFDIVETFKNMETNNDLFKEHVSKYQNEKSYKGISFYSDSKLTKHVALQEDAFRGNHDAKLNQMRQTIMHEVGHLFDNFFGHNHQDKVAQAWDSILSVHEKQKDLYIFESKTIRDKNIEKTFYKKNALSDNEDFLKALKEDISNIHFIKKLPDNLNYYITASQLNSRLKPEELKISETQRSEVYANLFSYIVGQDDGNRDKFLKIFEKSSKIVEKDIKKHLHVIK